MLSCSRLWSGFNLVASAALREPGVICIAGMHRSGTSMIAQLLHRASLSFGPPEKLLGADRSNPLGHFEHRDVLTIDRQLLKHFGATWYAPPKLPEKWAEAESLKPLLNQGRELAASFGQQTQWGWKEPRACLFLPFWRSAIPVMKFVLCLRDPLEVALSLQRRNRLTIDHGAWLWYHYTLASLLNSRNASRLVTVFDDYFNGSQSEAARLLEFCGMTAVGAADTSDAAVASELRHHRSSIETLHAIEAIPAQCKELYLGLRGLAGEPAPRIDAFAAEMAARSPIHGDFWRPFVDAQPRRKRSGLRSLVSKRIWSRP